MNQQAYPLSWPAAWKRVKPQDQEEAAFSSSSKRWIANASNPSGGYYVHDKRKKSMEDACAFLYQEFRRLGVTDDHIVVSTNVERRLDGQPYSNRKAPADPGAAVYFRLNGKPRVLACDKWLRVEDNLYAIACHVEALRSQERWGVGSVEQAFSGYTALPAPRESGGATYYQILGIAHDAPYDVAREAFLKESKLCHPDNGGSHEKQVRLNGAWDQARQAYGR